MFGGDSDMTSKSIPELDHRSLLVSAVVSMLFLPIWTAVLIYFMSAVYESSSGVWILVMVGILAILIIPVGCVTVLATSYLVARWVQCFYIAVPSCLLCVAVTPATIVWLNRTSFSYRCDYAVVAVFMCLPACLACVASASVISFRRPNLPRG